MNAELFIAKRIYRGDKKNDKRVSSPAIRIAIAGIALGLAVMIVAVCIIVGFKKEVRAKVIGFGSHIQVSAFESNASYEHTPIAISDTLLAQLNANPAISHVQEFITKPGIIKTDDDFMGVVLKGVSEGYDWQFFRKNLLEGSVIESGDTTSGNRAIISRVIADKLLLKTGDNFTCYFVQEPVRARRFRITGIYETNFEDYDKLYIITEKEVLARLNDWDDDMASGIELLVKDYDKLDATAQEIFFAMADHKDRLGNAFYTRSIKDINPMIFNWLDLLDMNVWVIVILMLVVSGFTMISGLLIIILERTNMIGILKSMGARDFSIRRVFLYLSAFLIGQGMLWGNLIALLFCFIQDRWQLLKLDPSTYYLSAVPVDINPLYIILLNVGTLIVSLLMMIGPSYLVAKIRPAKSIQFE
ncbi:MAG: ABC transporter permease [Bacteroidetes bacterium GWD2_45_23]|nr:MAG: ABC transporter permease [Bacteroidetes bacterium GWC2_46_850]OFX81089.1 MAG: ABC transporter permease [Bacteroidetes bacterium GWC1_47_7]OFX84904.1 MAG: ABC transporter permease [Bacteroidetes bacterium GWD2_45_23]HAR39668.1 ABC transporter permease [Porphyromonadaceae bacterium]HBB00220.1 ABC transporter permease [Porphyromonadaceae bacterium]